MNRSASACSRDFGARDRLGAFPWTPYRRAPIQGAIGSAEFSMCWAMNRRRRAAISFLRAWPIPRSVGETVRARRLPKRHAELVERLEVERRDRAAESRSRAKRATTNSSGVRILVGGGAPGASSATSAEATTERSPSLSRNLWASASTRSGGGASATKWRTSLVAIWRAVAGWRARSSRTARALRDARLADRSCRAACACPARANWA